MKETRLTVRGFTGMLDTLTPVGDPRRPFLLENCYLEGVPGTPTNAVMRQAWKRTSTTTMAGAALLGSELAGLVYEFVKLNGTIITIIICGGKFYTLDGSGVPVETLTAANLSGAGVTLSSSRMMWAVTFNNQVVFTDGVEVPWMWDGTSGSGITELTNAPVAYGAPSVYYAKLFFIKNTDQGTMVWSEENAANTGYEAGGYNNAWTLSQTGSSPLLALLGTNEGLYYWRSNSIGLVRGAVTSTFSTTGTHDAVSSSVGHYVTQRHNMPRNIGGYIWFADQFGRPCRLPLGGTPETVLWEQVQRRVIGGGAAAQTEQTPFNLGEDGGAVPSFGTMNIAYCGTTGHVLFTTTTGTSTVTLAYRFRVTDGMLCGVDRLTSISGVAWCPGGNSSSGPVLVGVGTADGSATVAVRWGQTGTLPPYGADQNQAASTTAYTVSVIGPMQGYDESLEWNFHEIVPVFETNDTSSSLVYVDYLTDQQHYSTLMSAQQSVTATDTGFQLKEQRARFGIKGYGAWIRVRIQLSGTDRIALKGWTVKAFALSDVAVAAP